MDFSKEQLDYLRGLTEKRELNLSIDELIDYLDNRYVEKYTFWQLIEEYTIEIPIVQRDYAQGREDVRITQIRENFVAEITSVLIFENEEVKKNLHLDFVYGSAKDNSPLVLLDGQQRMTTLFLFHWYLLSRLKKNRGGLERFTYKTRASSSDFCKTIVHEELEFNNSSLSENLKNQNWFFKSWEKDPTVKSMLVMLDSIHEVFEKYDTVVLEKAWNKLISRDSITFQFLNLKDFDLTDELYIKMNARGKQLSDFENFKAWLIQGVEDKGNKLMKPDLAKEVWSHKMDIEWTDLFWNLNEAEYEIDDKFMRFFNGMSLFFFIEKKYFRKQSNLNVLEKDKGEIESFHKYNYITIKTYDNLLNSENIGKCFSLLTILEGERYDFIYTALKDVGEEISMFLKSFLKENPNYWDRVRFYALYVFLIKTNSLDGGIRIDEIALKRWMRIWSNLINNQRIDSQEDFIKAIHSISQFSNKWEEQGCLDLYGFIQGNEIKLVYFEKKQWAEEKNKVELILANNAWEDILTKYEKHKYFYGQIGFLLKISNSDIHEFEKYASVAAAVFKENNIASKEYIIQRALLTREDYFINKPKNNKSFCLPNNKLDNARARDRDENWRAVFNDEYRVSLLKSLLDDLINSPKNNLETIIDEGKRNLTDWRSLFLKYPSNFSYCGKGMVRFEDSTIYLMSSTQRNHRHANLYARSLFLYLKKELLAEDYKPFEEIQFYEAVKSSDTSCGYMDWIYGETNYAIDIGSNALDKCYIRFFSRNTDTITAEIISILEAENFEEYGNDYRLEGMLFEGVREGLLSLIKKFASSIL